MVGRIQYKAVGAVSRYVISQVVKESTQLRSKFGCCALVSNRETHTTIKTEKSDAISKWNQQN
jgi:hypothetical protein